MKRPLTVGAGFGLAFGLYFVSSFFGWAFGADLVAVMLLGLLLTAAITLQRWAPSPFPFRAGLAFGAMAASALLLTWAALAGAGAWSFASDPSRAAFGLVGFLVGFALAAAALACLAWLGHFVAQRIERGRPAA